MLIGYVYPLGTVYLLYLIYQIPLYCFPAQNMQYILWVNRSVSKLLPCSYPVSTLNVNRSSGGNDVLPRFLLFITDKQMLIFNNYFASYTSRNSFNFSL